MQPLFAGMPSAFVQRLSHHATEVEITSGSVIFEEGAPADTLYLLVAGRVALSTRSPGKGNLLVQTLGPGELLGLSWIVAPYTWQFQARALEPVMALAIEGPALRTALDADPLLGYEVLRRLFPVVLDRLTQTRLRLLDLYSSSGDHETGSP